MPKLRSPLLQIIYQKLVQRVLKDRLFGDIFSTTPLQTNTIGTGAGTRSITQQFSQGNIVQSTNTLDMAISGEGFFALKTGGNAGQIVYTRNGSFDVNDAGYIVDSNGQFLMGYPVDSDGAVADTTLESANKLQLQSEYGDPKETNFISMGVNLPADAAISQVPLVLIQIMQKHTLHRHLLQYLIIWVTQNLQRFIISRHKILQTMMQHSNLIQKCL